jgi:hypothetical protein
MMPMKKIDVVTIEAARQGRHESTQATARP